MKTINGRWKMINVGVVIFGIAVAVVMWESELTSYGAEDLDGFAAETRRNRPSVAEATPPSAALPHITDDIESWQPDPADVEACAKMLYRECRGVESTTEQAATLWCVLNRVDSDAYPDTLIDVLRQPAQFAYDYDTPVCDELRELAEDVLTRHHREQLGEENVGRVLPREYLYFVGDGQRNHFMREWKSGEYWTWELESPYED